MRERRLAIDRAGSSSSRRRYPGAIPLHSGLEQTKNMSKIMWTAAKDWMAG
jgi:hypothetical protein